ncbi:2-dehydro-3-deoxygalactonokinase [Aquimarina spongiae]|uniref:2-dehydro-3-deoxygalactonokinase n=1 Tax=Aquimarina spongiae TaxID=570521 RepID=A0A1M6A0X9_9FLAO|nr:2-dehydro-3-deoxygalactonokinase [Aquimarina spongiae]SHI30184.1 2-dehydro-3-deoxygalactonokinase [Aquimarina spongiae]
MNLPKQFISCDWGTTNFRIRLVDTKNLKVIQEHKTNLGVSKLYQKYLEQKEFSQEAFFKNYLLKQLNVFSGIDKNNLLVIASGMITSTIGMKELKYASVPQSINGQDILCCLTSLAKGIQLLLISGVKTKKDVIRGEEAQVIGLMDHISEASEGIIVLPGTHSKHITFLEDKIYDFSTFMTGELFEILSTQSILSFSMTNIKWDPKFSKIFLDGVQKGINNEIMKVLFSIRANNILHHTKKEMNFYYLSGLIIGSELAHLKQTEQQIFLGASGMLQELYSLALASNIPAENFTCFKPEIIDNALLLGHKKIAKAYA